MLLPARMHSFQWFEGLNLIRVESCAAVTLPVGSDKFGLADDFALQGQLNLLGGCSSRIELQLLAQSVEASEVAMCAGGWARPCVAELSRIVLTLQAGICDRRILGQVFADMGDSGRNIVQQPMRETVGTGRIGIVKN